MYPKSVNSDRSSGTRRFSQNNDHRWIDCVPAPAVISSNHKCRRLTLRTPGDPQQARVTGVGCVNILVGCERHSAPGQTPLLQIFVLKAAGNERMLEETAYGAQSALETGSRSVRVRLAFDDGVERQPYCHHQLSAIRQARSVAVLQAGGLRGGAAFGQQPPGVAVDHGVAGAGMGPHTPAGVRLHKAVIGNNGLRS